MIRFAVVGTNWITERFIDAAHESGKLKLSAVYSRSLEQAQAFGANYQVTQFFDSLETIPVRCHRRGVYRQPQLPALPAIAAVPAP